MLNEFQLGPIRPVPYWVDTVQPLWRRCIQRILIVADGLSFNPADGFGLSRFIAEIAKITPTPVITKAHRGTDPTADKQAFTFDSSVTTSNYDQIWLLGIQSSPVLPDAEIKVLADFMAAGGGLFATGDHDDLGYAMGGELPRVRKMRDWSSIPGGNEFRIDTVTNSGPHKVTHFHDQSDEFPQRIFPHYYGSGSSWMPHPLLRSPIRDIDVMPDHPHESVCLVGSDLGDPYNLHGLNFPEFPLFGSSPLAPEVIATSVSAGRYLVDFNKPPTAPRCFGSISVWDGHKVGLGRIVCDATWHHFVNINLDGTGAVPATGKNRNGLRDTLLNFTEDFHQVAEYYRNIADWIIPKNRRKCHWWIDFVVERYRFPLIEEYKPLPHPCPWEPRLKLGILVEDALNANRGRGYAAELVTEFLEAAEFEDFASVVRPVEPKSAARISSSRLLLNADDLRRGILASLFDAFVRDLPINPLEMVKVMQRDKHNDEKLVKEADKALASAIDAARDYYNEAAKQTVTFLKEKGPSKGPKKVTSKK